MIVIGNKVNLIAKYADSGQFAQNVAVDYLQVGFIFVDSPPTTAHEFFAIYKKWPWDFKYMEPHEGRKTLIPEIVDRMLYHWCPECGRWAEAGMGFNPKKDKLGDWYCSMHIPDHWANKGI